VLAPVFYVVFSFQSSPVPAAAPRITRHPAFFVRKWLVFFEADFDKCLSCRQIKIFEKFQNSKIVHAEKRPSGQYR
jgi:hypothetical protein